jgi:putative YhdH/YhfP family quinone oxidoreductase
LVDSQRRITRRPAREGLHEPEPASAALRVHEADGATRGVVESVTLDHLSPGEVVVQVAWSSLNYKDALAITGRGRILRGSPRIPGVDLAGQVVASSDARWQPGDAVLATGYELGMSHDGGLAEYARLPADWPVPLPAGLSLLEAMQLGTAGFTAGLAISRLEQLDLAPGKGPVAVTGASGGVSTVLIDQLAGLGYEVVAISSKPGRWTRCARSALPRCCCAMSWRWVASRWSARASPPPSTRWAARRWPG